LDEDSVEGVFFLLELELKLDQIDLFGDTALELRNLS